jgi:hypothetical protein
MMRSESYETSEAATGLFASVAAAHPQKLMDGIGEALLSKERRLRFLFRKFPIGLLPENIAVQWIEKHGLEGARLLARHVPAPFTGTNGPDLNPLTRHILQNYGNDEIVFSGWIAGINSGGAFAGSIADHMERRAAVARPFLTFPIEAVRRWAQAEVTFAERNVEGLRLEEEELF